MNIDTHIFFLVVLGGFAIVWSFRKASRSENDIKDFEYLGFSSFWGIVLVLSYVALMKGNPKDLEVLLSNPFVAGIVLPIAGGLVGGSLGYLKKLVQKK